MPRKQAIFEPEYIALAARRNILFVGPLPSAVGKKTTWKCHAGHQWQATYADVRNGPNSICRICTPIGTVQRLTEQNYIDRGIEFGYTYLGPHPGTAQKKTGWRCARGHIRQCSINGLNKCAKCRSLPESDYQSLADELGIRWNGPFPRTSGDRTSWTCRNGHTFSKTYWKLKNTPSCTQCRIAALAQKCSDLANEKGIELVGKFPDTVADKTEWRCSRGHIFSTSYNVLRRGDAEHNGCILCHIDSITGENNPRWRGGMQPNNKNVVVIAKKLARRRDGYCCQICGCRKKRNGRVLDVHHIIPFRFSDSGQSDIRNLVTLCHKHHLQAEWHLRDSIYLLRILLIHKYGYVYTSEDMDYNALLLNLNILNRKLSKRALMWVTEYPDTFSFMEQPR